jgi:hypothetical protein
VRALDTQVGGGHYKDMAIQPVQFITALQMGFCEGNAIKYLVRWRFKGGLQDIEKAAHYIDLLLENPNYQGVFYAARERGRRQGTLGFDSLPLERFVDDNGIEGLERSVISHLYYWNKTARRCHLVDAKTCITALLEAEGG